MTLTTGGSSIEAVETNTDQSNTAAWMKVTFAGAVAMAAWSIAVQALAGIIPPVAVIGFIFTVFAVFLHGDRPRLGLIAAIVATLTVLGSIPIIVDDLSNPESAPAFILNLVSMAASALVVIGGFSAFRRFSGERIGVVARVVSIAIVVGAVASVLVASNTISIAAAITDTQVVASRVAWEPGEISVAVGRGVWIDNRDGIRHTFTIENTDIDLEIAALKSNRIDLDLAPGSYHIVCTVPGHESMTGMLTVLR